MSEQTVWSVDLCQTEFICLAAYLGLPAPEGLGQAINELAGTKAQQRIECARQSLIQRGVLRCEADGSQSLDASVAIVLRGATLADYTTHFAVTGMDGASKFRWVHQSPGIIVEQEPTDDQAVKLSALRDRGVLLERLTAFVDVPVSTGVAPAFSVERQVFDEACQMVLADEQSEALRCLQAGEVPLLAAQSLCAVLAGHYATGSMLVRRRLEPQPIGRRGWLIGEEATWLLSNQPDSTRIVFEPTLREQFGTSLMDTLPAC